MTHNLEWRDVKSLFEEVGEVEKEHNGNLKITVRDQAVVFHSPTDTDIATTEQVNQFRHLLKGHSPKPGEDSGPYLLLVIDHACAKVYRTEFVGSVPERIIPEDNLGHQKHVHSAHDYSDHIAHPNPHAYFEAVSKSLRGAEKVLIFGSGTGSSNAMEIYCTWLHERYPSLFERVVGQLTVDESHLTEGELLSKAREVYRRY